MYFLNHVSLLGSNVTVSSPLPFQTLESARATLRIAIGQKLGYKLPPPALCDGTLGFMLEKGKAIRVDEAEHTYGTAIIDESPDYKEVWYISSDENKSDCWRVTSSIHYPVIVDVIFNNPATIVFWDDGTKTVVKCQDGDVYSKETGLAMAMLKRYMGNDNTYNKEINAWLGENE